MAEADILILRHFQIPRSDVLSRSRTSRRDNRVYARSVLSFFMVGAVPSFIYKDSKSDVGARILDRRSGIEKRPLKYFPISLFRSLILRKS
jgi:hypothetical protein